MRNLAQKIGLQKEYIEELVWGASVFLAVRPPFYVIFCYFFVYSLPFVYSDFT